MARHFAKLALAAVAFTLGVNAQTCSNVTIPISIQAVNKNLTSLVRSNVHGLNGTALTNMVVASPNLTVGGHYTVTGTYCLPNTASNSTNSNKLQVLVHGADYTRSYWSGLAPEGTYTGQDVYSWTLYAANQGYPTLAVDRLCNGESTTIQGTSDCQTALNAESINAVIEAARSGNITGIYRSYNKIIYVGHSYGSQIGNALSVMHPTAADVTILTGFSASFGTGLSGGNLGQDIQAYKADPARFALFKGNPEYLAASNETGLGMRYYAGNFTQATLDLNWSVRGTTTVGEKYTAVLGQFAANAYTGPVFILNGALDGVCCATSPQAASVGAPGDCTNSLMELVKQYYPATSNFGYAIIGATGHDLNTHTTAPESFAATFNWLNAASF